MTAVSVTVFSDYSCPFCYVAQRRLQRAAQSRPLEVNWRFVEIHPESPPEGLPVDELGYGEEEWQMMMGNLATFAAEEGLELAGPTYNPNSHQALLLAEAARNLAPRRLPDLSEGLFSAFFSDGRNISDTRVLRDVARGAGVAEQVVEAGWNDPSFEERLMENHMLAACLGVGATPTFVIGTHVIPGVVSMELLMVAIDEQLERGAARSSLLP